MGENRTGKAKHGAARAKILNAGDILFAERGYAGVSMRDVAQEAGVAKAAVFYYFDGKNALYDEVLERYYRAHQAALAEALNTNGDLATRLRHLIDVYLDFIVENAHYARLVQRQLCDGGGDIDVVRRNLSMLLKGVETAFEGVTPSEGPLAARHFFVTLSGAVINYFTYAPALDAAWPKSPLEASAIEDRRSHLHWLVDTVARAL